MNLKELIASTNNVRGRGQAKVFQKKFGSIYAYNKNVSVAKNGKAIVISMIIGGVTDMIKIGNTRTPVPFHRVALALNVGEDGKKEYTATELVEAIRAKHSEYRDEQKWPNPDVLKEALKNPDKFFDNATIFKSNNKGVDFVVVTNKIPEDSEVQVWCSCSDYYWTFAYYNQYTRNKDGSSLNLYGGAGFSSKVYNHRSAKGKDSKRPLRNPGRHPGMCKHLMLLVAMLMKDNIITDTKGGLKKYYEANYNEFLRDKERSLVSQRQLEARMKQYKEGEKQLNQQRTEAQQILGNKTEVKFREDKMSHDIVTKTNRGTKYNAITGRRTYGNAIDKINNNTLGIPKFRRKKKR